MIFRIELPQNTESEFRAFETTCERLAGFDPELDPESVDGFLTSLAAAPRVPEAEAWLMALFGETFERVFADPPDRAAALQSLQRRLSVLCAQLDPQALFDAPGTLRLEPAVHEWTDADRQALSDEAGPQAHPVAGIHTGGFWAEGFLEGVRSFPDLWQLPDDDEAPALFEQSFANIRVLTLEPGDEKMRAHLETVFGAGSAPDREDLFIEACLSVQDLRMYWVDFAPRGSTRRVEPTPGRNDACPCGSGKKYKKCHGAAA